MTELELRNKLKTAIELQDSTLLAEAIELFWHFEQKELFENEFNQLILTPNHSQHQYLLKHLQDVLRFESSVPYLDKALTQGFAYLNHYSEDGTIAKWFSHALWSIGTPEAITVLKKHAKSTNEQIRDEMLYRLLKNKVIDKIPYEPVNLKLTTYLEHQSRLPLTGNYFIAHSDTDILTFYAAFNDAIANYAIANQCFGGNACSFNRMTWIKPSFMWMMYRSSWASAENQKRILALKVKKQDIITLLREGVLSNFDATKYNSEDKWKNELADSEVRIQWDPDHTDYGMKLARKVIQIGLKGNLLKVFSTEMLIQIEDITSFVNAQRVYHLFTDDFNVPLENIISFEESFPLLGI